LISGLIDHAARVHGRTEIVSREFDRTLHRTNYAKVERRARRLAKALRRLGIGEGDRVASLAWNTHRHLEVYYGVSGMGAVLHTVNPRLFPEQLIYMINHASDRILFADGTFVPLLEKLLPHLPLVERIVLLLPEAAMPPSDPEFLSYEALLDAEDEGYAWPEFDERRAAMLCYTSGTTGNPKGALYSHRSTVLHAMASSTADMLGLTAGDSVCPVVPMFHACAWGTAYSAPLTGARLVMPGQHLDGESLCSLFREERVTCSAGVPTLWLGALDHAGRTGNGFGPLKRVLIGGSAAPPSMIDAFASYGIEARQGWGMTEMSPLGTVAALKHHHADAPEEDRRAAIESQGRPPYLVEMKLVGAEGQVLPHDGTSIGEVWVRGAWIISGYFGDEAATRDAFDRDGWFRTGDVGTIDEDGYLRLTDRAKDVIKSGGEWISSIDLENAALAHPDVGEAAVIGVPHPKWSERPLLVVVLQPGRPLDKEAILAFLAERVARWWLPDDIVAMAEIPHSATGKISKAKLRDDFRDYRRPSVA
ncbi:MAG TPA: long-chain fatty acid--CoA ligase, partial [Stellaceae bacterium]|nr:long-chain fatty acid--CoA ligase [Stellaceae bacterium]